MPEIPCCGRPLEPDPCNGGVGNGIEPFSVFSPGNTVFFCDVEKRMKIILNGLEYETAAHSVAELLRELSIEVGRVAVEVNLEIVRKVDYESRGLGQGDKVEIVNYVGGG